jgi:hypothetical protein
VHTRRPLQLIYTAVKQNTFKILMKPDALCYHRQRAQQQLQAMALQQSPPAGKMRHSLLTGFRYALFRYLLRCRFFRLYASVAPHAKHLPSDGYIALLFLLLAITNVLL